MKYKIKNHSGQVEKYLILFLIGALVYPFIEMLWRGYTHSTMAIVGGIGLCFVYYADGQMRGRAGLLVRAILCGVIITVIEFVAGCVLNLWLGLGVWDYSSSPFNILGQVCLGYTVLWMTLCVPGLLLCGVLRDRFERSSVFWGNKISEFSETEEKSDV